MSPLPETTSIGNTKWTQHEDGDAGLELRIPLTLPEGFRPKELTVEVKDTTVLCISCRDERILQWRLYAAVSSEVAWSVEPENVMVVELEKTRPAVWSCLLDLPLRADDELLVPEETISRMLVAQLPSLPSVTPNEDDAARAKALEAQQQANEDGKTSDGDHNLDQLLEEATKELKGPVAKEDEDASGPAVFIKAELDNYKTEEQEIAQKLGELAQQLDHPGEGESTDAAMSQRGILNEMLRLHNMCRELRSEPSTLSNFLRCTQLDLQKARVNIGETDEEETEEFDTEEEKQMSATELMACGLKLFEEQDIKGCLHFFRLAAVHHQHEQSVLLLYSIYSQLNSPRGAFMLLKCALNDASPSAMVNQRVGELYDSGARHFLPLFPMALFFYQRAAKLGSVNAMLSLAQLWLRGATSSTMLSEEEVEAQRNIAKYHAWLNKACDRGCGSAYFVKGCMHLKGEHGAVKSYEDAKRFLDAASSAQPEIMRRAPQIPIMLDLLRQQEHGGDASKNSSPATTSSTKVAKPAAAADDDEVPQETSSAARLNALSALSRGANAADRPQRAKKAFGSSAKRKAFWERTCVTGITLYSAYTLLFPVRILMMPLFYSFISRAVEAIPWLGNPNADLTAF